MHFSLIALAVAAVAHAQSNSTANSTLIPAGISDSCSTFLTNLNADDSISACVQPLINATASFSPVSGGNLTSDDINYALGAICKQSAGCSDSLIRPWLASFYSNCQNELTSKEQYSAQIRELYDILYVVNPLKGAVCAINSADQEYCVNEILTSERKSNSSSSASASASSAAPSASGAANSTFIANNFATFGEGLGPVAFAAENLYITITSASSSFAKRLLNYMSARQAAQQSFATIITPNATTYRNTNLPFLFLQPSMAQADLCTPCTREVFVSYIKWESQQPYALGLSQSPILGGQSALWNAINSTCDPAFVNAITSQVGTFSTDTSAASVFATPSALAVVIAGVSGLMAILA